MIEVKLSFDEAEMLHDLTQHAGLVPLFRCMAGLVHGLEQSVVTFDLGSRPVEELVRLKSQAEGARKLFQGIQAHLEKIRLASSSAPAVPVKKRKR